MAILHRATLSPSKPELLHAWLDRQPWSGAGAVEVVGAYRFDDPAGEVGVEAFVVRRGEALLHVVLSYRDAPLAGAEPVGTLEHSVLGTRWVYDGSTDPVATGCFTRALHGEQEQAVLEVWDGDTLVRRTESPVRVRREPGTDGVLRIERTLGGPVEDSATRLVATWDGGSAVVATLVAG